MRRPLLALALLFGLSACPASQPAGPDLGSMGGPKDAASANGWVAESSGGSADLLAVACSATEVLAVGAAGTVLRRSATGAWSPEPGFPPTTAALRALSLNQGGVVHVAGDAGAIFRRASGSWSSPVTNGTSNAVLRGALTFADGGAVVVGDAGALLVSSFSDPQFYPLLGQSASFAAVAGLSLTDYAIVGAGGVLLHGGGYTPSPEASGTTTPLSAVAFDASFAVAVGDLGTVLRRSGGQWSAAASATTQPLYAVAIRDLDVTAVGAGGTLVRSSDGGVSFGAAQLGARTLRGLCSSALGTFAVGDGGAIWHRPF